MKTTEEMIAVMQAYCDGKEIESCLPGDTWLIRSDPKWNWYEVDYRVKKQTKKMKLLAWFNGESLFWTAQAGNGCSSWKRVPSEDKIIEIEVGE